MKEWVEHRNKIRKSLYDIEQALWRARAEAERNSNYHTQLGHAIDALTHLKHAFAIAVPQPNTGSIKSWYTIDELNAWADKYDTIQERSEK